MVATAAAAAAAAAAPAAMGKVPTPWGRRERRRCG